MKINVKERNIEVNESLRDYAVTKVGGLSRYFDGIISVDVTLKVEKEREIAEVIAHLIKNKIVKATSESKDLYVSIDDALDKIKRQIKKYKSKIRDKDLPSDVEIASGQVFHTDRGGIERQQLTLGKPMTPREAIIKLENDKRDFFIFMDSKRNVLSVLHRRNDGNYEIVEPIY